MDSTELYHIAAIPGSCVNEVVSFTEEIPRIYVTVQESIASTLYLVPYIAAIPELSEERNRVYTMTRRFVLVEVIAQFTVVLGLIACPKYIA